MVYKKLDKDRKQERVSIFIDGSNFYHSVKKVLKLKERVNYQKLINILADNNEIVDVFYYIARLDYNVDIKRYENHEKFLKSLAEIPKLKIKLCNLKKIKTKDKKFIYVVKSDDIQLAQDILIGAFDDLYDTAIIVSGDEDFLLIINTIKERFKKKVINAYFRSSSSYRLRNICDFSIKLNKIIPQFIDEKK